MVQVLITYAQGICTTVQYTLQLAFNDKQWLNNSMSPPFPALCELRLDFDVHSLFQVVQTENNFGRMCVSLSCFTPEMNHNHRAPWAVLKRMGTVNSSGAYMHNHGPYGHNITRLLEIIGTHQRTDPFLRWSRSHMFEALSPWCL